MCSVDVVWRLWNWSGLAKFESLKEKIDKRRANLCLGASLLGFKIPTGDMRNERENYLSIRQRKGECGLHLSKLSEWYSFRFWITLPWWHLCDRSFSWGEPPQSTQKLSSRLQLWKPICWVRFLRYQLVSSPSSQPTQIRPEMRQSHFFLTSLTFSVISLVLNKPPSSLKKCTSKGISSTSQEQEPSFTKARGVLPFVPVAK